MRRLRPSSSAQGGTLLVTLITLTALTMLAAYTFRTTTPGLALAHQNLAWQESRLAAEAGVDIAMNDLLMNATGFSAGKWSGWQETPVPPQSGGSGGLLGALDNTLDGTVKVATRLVSSTGNLLQPLKGVLGNTVQNLIGGIANLSITPSSTSSRGAGPVNSSQSIYLDNVKLPTTSGTPAEVNIQLWALEPSSNPNAHWFRIRSMGTCPLPRVAVQAPADLDAKLRRFSLKTRRQNLQDDDVGSPTTVALPNVSRTVEVLVEPVLAFELALWTGDKLTLPNVGTWNVDSFDSTSKDKSAGGLYPGFGSTQAQANGNVASSAQPDPDTPFAPAIFANGTKIRGAVATDGGDDPETTNHENVAGSLGVDPARIHDDFNRRMIPMQRPEGEFQISPPNDTFVAGPLNAPAMYSIHGDLREIHFAPRPGTGITGAVVIMVDGNLDLTDTLDLPPSTIAILFVRGDITLRSNVNSGAASSNRASQLMIFGDAPEGKTQTLSALGGGKRCAAFYGPNADAEFDGGVNWIGSVNARTFRTLSSGMGGIHYDESLATVGPAIGFRIVRYVEDVRE